VVFRVFPDLESGLKIVKIFRKNPEKSEKNRIYIYMLGTLFRVLPAVFRVHCGFPNMESEAVPNEK
jgi:hypothetical protein